MKCPECGSTETEWKMYCILCANCRVVLKDETPPKFNVVINNTIEGDYYVRN